MEIKLGAAVFGTHTFWFFQAAFQGISILPAREALLSPFQGLDFWAWVPWVPRRLVIHGQPLPPLRGYSPRNFSQEVVRDSE
ncbi:MAG: hypothetical protein LBI02_06280, partial [Opitutaceae bacterium]|nr:hypothetical protein [Opitutaceae bacterium]